MRSSMHLLAALLLVAITFSARAQDAGAPRGTMRGNPAAAPEPPPPSVPPVTRLEVDAVLAALGEAYRREDERAVERLHAEEGAVAFKAGRDAQRAFVERNALALTFGVQSEESMSDGALSVVALTAMSYVPAGSSHARVEKRRWRFVFARRPGRGVVLASQVPAEAGLLPAQPPWRQAHVRGEIRLPTSSDTPRVAVDVTLTLQNASDSPAGEVSFALHPFSSGLRAFSGEAALEARRTEASLDAWHVRLAQPVDPGGSAELRLRYELEQPGEVAASVILGDLVRLYTSSAWLPIVEPVRPPSPPERTHDLVVIAPQALAFSMPGLRTQLPAPADGFHSSRFVSELPAAETPLVAVQGRLESRALGPDLELEVLRAEGGGDPARAISHVTTLSAFLEDRLGPAPVRRLALVEALGGGFREAPGWLALPSLAIPSHDADREESDQVFLFVGLGLARLRLLHALAPTGVGARDLSQGLCEHLVGQWAGASVRPDVPVKQRSLILESIQMDPQLDRPLLPPVEDPRTPAIFKHGKARMVFDSYAELAGSKAWASVLYDWARGSSRGAHVNALISRMGGTPEKDAFVDAFFQRQGAAQVRIADIRMLPLPTDEAARLGLDAQAWKRVEIEVENAGLGPVPVEMRVEIDQALRHERVIVPEYGRAVLALVAAAPPTRIRLDPQRILWQSRSDDDVYPNFQRTKREEFDAVAREGHQRKTPSETEIRRDPRP